MVSRSSSLTSESREKQADEHSFDLGRLRSPKQLIDAGLVLEGDRDAHEDLASRYDIGVSAHVYSRIADKGNALSDPVGRQYVPSVKELKIQNNEMNDPIGDDVYSPARGIVHRYPDRVLFKVTNVCAVYCRYCFRREMIGAGTDHLSDDDIEHALDYIRAQKSIWEVILTGGDPLVLSPRRLSYILQELDKISHVEVIRIHTRLPIVDPGKINDTLISVLKSISKGIHIVLHVNHTQELSDKVKSSIFSLRMAGCSLFSQSVLLKNVNDNAEVLENLFRKLICLHVHPYYLHHMDRAKGTSHFRVSLERGMEIMRDLQGRVSGLCLPKYMLDIPGGYGKIPIDSAHVTRLDGATYQVVDYQGDVHLYIDTGEE